MFTNLGESMALWIVDECKRVVEVNSVMNINDITNFKPL